MLTFSLETSAREALIDITDRIQTCLQAEGVRAGAVLVFSPHTTVGLTINEGVDPDVRGDMLNHLRTVVPQRGAFRHAEGNSDAHIKASVLGSSVTLILEKGVLRLGAWQRVFLGEFDGPRQRTIWIQPLS